MTYHDGVQRSQNVCAKCGKRFVIGETAWMVPGVGLVCVECR